MFVSWGATVSVIQCVFVLRLSCRLSNSYGKSSRLILSSRAHLVNSNAMLLNLSLVIEYLKNVFINLIFEKLLSHEALVNGSVWTINSNLNKQSNAALR